jgi:monothiol glutaredoxin
LWVGIAMTPSVQEKIDTLVKQNKIMLFMKGSKLMPQCGFSNNAVQIFNSLGVPFETFDVLSDPEIRQGIKDYSNWPTIPQVFINGEFVGGSDILIELYQKGELQEMLEVALAS